MSSSVLDDKLFSFPELDFELVIEVTNQCHGNCAYCFYDPAMPIRVFNPSRLLDFLQLLKQTSTKRRGTIYFQGAEALLAPDSFWIACAMTMQQAKKLGFTLSCHLQSGLYVMSSRVHQVMQLFPYFTTFSTSFDLSREGLAPSKIKQLITEFQENASAASSEIQFSSAAILTLSRANIGAIREVLDIYLDELGVQKLRFRELVPTQPRVTSLQHDEVFPSIDETLCLFDEIFHNADKLSEFEVVEPFRSMASFLLGYKPFGTCMLSVGCANLFALARNQIGSCDIALELTRDQLAFADWSHSNVADFITNVATWRTRLPEECKSCRYVQGCSGGCPLRAHLVTGDVRNKDPFCEVVQRIYTQLEHEQCQQTSLWKSLEKSVYASEYLRMPISSKQLY